MGKKCKIKGCNKPMKARGWCSSHWHLWYRYGDPNYKNYRRKENMTPNEMRAWFLSQLKPVSSPKGVKGKCRIWTRATNYGYGVIRIGSKTIRTHRFAWFLKHGYYPKLPNMLCHKCDVRVCCNTKHMYVGTAKDNVDDMWKRNPQPR